MAQVAKSRYIDEWIQVPLCNNGEKLYHYTTAEGVQGIVESKQFIATKSDFLNDKMEFLYALEILEKLVDTYIVNRTMGKAFFQMVQEAMDELAIVTPSCQTFCSPKQEAMSFYVVAFSKQENSALLWAEFTDFKGYCLGFDYEKLVLGFSNRAFLHGTVIYDEKTQTECLLEALLSCIRRAVQEGRTDLELFFEETGTPKEESLREMARDMALVCSVYAMFFKSEFFAGEEEYRFVFSPLLHEHNGKPRFRIADQVFLPYIMVQFDGDDMPIPLESVMVGAKNNSDIAIRGVRSFLKGQGLEIPVTLSDIPLRY